MCFFKKKKKIKPSGKFAIGEMVVFRYEGALTTGFVYALKAKEDGTAIYDIQLAGQCPAILYNIEESELRKK